MEGRSTVTGRQAIKRTLTLDSSSETAQLERVFKALDSANRIKILRFLADRIASVNDIAIALDIPMSTAALHVQTLEEAGLIHTELEPASRGLRKVCARMYDQIVLDLPVSDQPREQVIELNMPIGAYVDCHVTPTCGMAGASGLIGLLDDPTSFYEPDHVGAQLIWFHQGYLEYRFPNRLPSNARPETLAFSAEVCSEAPLHNPVWPSDITVWVNGIEIGTWTSPADFGGERGRLTPEWWTPRNTQYGLLKVWQVSEQETRLDGTYLSNVTIDDLKLSTTRFITVRIGVRADAEHIGGINLFGSRFGNYPQDLNLRIGYRAASRAATA